MKKKYKKRPKLCQTKYEVRPGVKVKCFGKFRRIRKTSWRKGQNFCISCTERAVMALDA